MHNKYIILTTNICLTNQFGGNKKKQWNTLSHNGVLFPPEYIQHNIPLLYKNNKIYLDKESEEYATIYAKYHDSEYINNKYFKTNFWKDWKKILNNKYNIDNLDDCDFSLMYDYILNKPKIKQEQDQENKYKIAIIDGKEQPVGNYRVEPPGIFIGRGCNPKLGKIKKRILPEDITINIGKEAKIPELVNNQKWGNIIHDKTSIWLASWKDDITGKIKYVWLGNHSDAKIKSDIYKFDLARKLKKKIKIIIEENQRNLNNQDINMRQIATALYLIYKLALRVGNEKGEDETDTVGITSLRKEHIFLLDNNKIKLDFLGKDSVRYINTVTVDNQVYTNLHEFIKDKTKDDDIFDKINSQDINKYLQTFMKELTAKVFRTYNASNLFQKELKKINKKYETYDEIDKIDILLNEFNSANAKVALLCNHQKNISKSFKDTVDKLDSQIKKLKYKLKSAKNQDKIKSKIEKLKNKKNLKVQLKNVSLGTSKINYIDPRITVAFMKKHNLNIDKVFSKTLQEKFKWAFNVDVNFKF